MLLISFFRRCNSTLSKMKILNVAEKNDAAKSLADIMSGGRYNRREGFSRFNKIYEFNYNLLGQSSSMIMTSVSGHLLAFRFPLQFKSWKSCSPQTLFDAPVEKYCPDDYKDIKRTLEREAKMCQALIIWTDCDREGENIGMEIIQVCTAVKPSLRVYRARFSEITPQAVQRACDNLQPPDQNSSNAVDVRSELDLRIGAAFTRFQTLRLQKVFPDVLAEQLISYGSCQFPTLGFVVERYKQVQAFIAEPFWKIIVKHETEDGAVDFNWKRVHLFDHMACLVLYENVIESPIATVTDVRTKPKSKWRPVALDTVEMEKLGSRKLNINAKEIMKIAEKLYTQGFISYPRTETNIFPKELDIRGLVQNQTQDPQWGGFAQRLLEQGPFPRNGKKTDKAHPPIHPTKYTNGLQGNEKRVYEFIVRHFLACCSKDAQGQETVCEIEIADEVFSASGLMIIAKNYLEVYPYERWNAKVMPVFKQGEQFQPKTIEMNQGKTSSPSLLTEADLIALMDKHGIGTDATHAEHIETIKSRLYVGVRNDGKFLPGELGMGLVEGYDSIQAIDFEMSKPYLRSGLEADLQRICDGLKDPAVVLANQIQIYKTVFIQAVQNATRIDQALSNYFGNPQQYTEEAFSTQSYLPVRQCPNCGKDMTLRTKKDGNGFFIGCMGYPDCKSVIWIPSSVLQASTESTVCDNCRPGPVRLMKFKFKKGSYLPNISAEYTGCIGCDRELRELLDINDRVNTGSRPITTASQTGTGSRKRPLKSLTPQTSQQSRPLGTVAPSSSQRPRPAPSSRTQNILTVRQPDIQPSTDTAIVCTCGTDARIFTVRKDGPNQGRQFYKCNKPQDSNPCNFFLWADEDPNPDHRNNSGGFAGGSGNGPGGGFSGASFGGGSYGGSSQSSKWSNSNPAMNDSLPGLGDTPQCQCGQPARQNTVKKEGPNTGRTFYSCSKPIGQGCKFFEWGDENMPVQTNHGGGISGPHGSNNSRLTRGGASNRGSGTRAKKKCSICKGEGHTKRTCPDIPY